MEYLIIKTLIKNGQNEISPVVYIQYDSGEGVVAKQLAYKWRTNNAE